MPSHTVLNEAADRLGEMEAGQAGHGVQLRDVVVGVCLTILMMLHSPATL